MRPRRRPHRSRPKSMERLTRREKITTATAAPTLLPPPKMMGPLSSDPKPLPKMKTRPQQRLPRNLPPPNQPKTSCARHAAPPYAQNSKSNKIRLRPFRQSLAPKSACTESADAKSAKNGLRQTHCHRHMPPRPNPPSSKLQVQRNRPQRTKRAATLPLQTAEPESDPLFASSNRGRERQNRPHPLALNPPPPKTTSAKIPKSKRFRMLQKRSRTRKRHQRNRSNHSQIQPPEISSQIMRPPKIPSLSMQINAFACYIVLRRTK